MAAARGGVGLRSEEAFSALELVLANHTPQVGVVSRLALDRTGNLDARPFFQDLARETGGTTSAADAAARELFLRRLRSAAPPERRALITEHIVARTRAVIGLDDASPIDETQPLSELGFDSLMALELRNRLESALGRTLSATLAWNYPTVDALVDYLAGGPAEVAPRESAAVAPAVAAPVDGQLAATLGAVAALSDDEIARALRAGR